MLYEVFQELDQWMAEANRARFEEGTPPYSSCTIRVVGQTALLEANLEIELPATVDVDVFADYQYAVQKKFEQLLAAHNRILDPVGHEAWMPSETEYVTIYGGRLVLGSIAKPEYVLVAKALKAPIKNKTLLVDYLAHGPTKLFLELARRYKVDLGEFVK
jgi:hypothetical protein